MKGRRMSNYIQAIYQDDIMNVVQFFPICIIVSRANSISLIIAFCLVVSMIMQNGRVFSQITNIHSFKRVSQTNLVYRFNVAKIIHWHSVRMSTIVCVIRAPNLTEQYVIIIALRQIKPCLVQGILYQLCGSSSFCLCVFLTVLHSLGTKSWCQSCLKSALFLCRCSVIHANLNQSCRGSARALS